MHFKLIYFKSIDCPTLTGTGVQGKRVLGVRSGKILRVARSQGGHVEYKYYSGNLQRRSMAINSIYKIKVWISVAFAI